MSDPDLDLDALDALCAAWLAGEWSETTQDEIDRELAVVLPALLARVRALAQENATLQAENTMLHGQHWHLHATMIE